MKEEFNPQFEQGENPPLQTDEASVSEQPLTRAGDSALTVTAQDATNSDEPSPGVWGDGIFETLPEQPEREEGTAPSESTEAREPLSASEISAAREIFSAGFNKLENLVSTARETADKLKGQAEATTNDPEGAARLRQHMTTISEGLGTVATNITEITEETRGVSSLDTPELQSRLNGDVVSLLGDTPGESPNLVGINHALRRHEIDTVRKILLTGESGLKGIRNIAADRIATLKGILSAKIPQIPLPHYADPVLGARLCHSLEEVPLAILDPSNKALAALRMEGHSNLSVEDMLGTNRFYNNVVDEAWLSRNSVSPEDGAALRNMAAEYARAFLEEKHWLDLGPL